MYNFRTDMAVERRDIYKKTNGLNEIDGIKSEKENIDDNLNIERVFITNENGEKTVGKPKGSYVTIDIKNLKIAREEEIQKASDILTSELGKILDKHITRKEEVLIVTWKYLCNSR